MKAILTVSFLLGLITLAFVSGTFYDSKATVYTPPNPPTNNNITNNLGLFTPVKYFKKVVIFI